MQSIIDKLTNNLVVAAFVPSVVFCTAAMVLFGPLIPTTVIRNIVDVYQGLGLFFLFAAFALSLFLVYLRELIIGLYRGRFFPKWLSVFEKRRAQKRMQKILTLRQRVQEAERAEDDSEQVASARDELYVSVSDYQSSFPVYSPVTATRLGNILAAAENCIMLRYKLDPVVVLPNLVQVLPPSAYQQIDNAFNQMLLLINSSLLSFGLFITCVISIIERYANQGAWQGEHIEAAIVSLILFYAFYLGALPIARYYSSMYCAAFSLYRFEVLKQLKLDLPHNSREEADTWRKVCELMAVGEEFGPLEFDYNHTGEPTRPHRRARQTTERV
jgi:hypothetical protein